MPLAGGLTYTREELLRTYGGDSRNKRLNGEKPLIETQINTIEAKQSKRNPNWKPGDPLLVCWSDIADATGAVALPGNF